MKLPRNIYMYVKCTDRFFVFMALLLFCLWKFLLKEIIFEQCDNVIVTVLVVSLDIIY